MIRLPRSRRLLGVALDLREVKIDGTAVDLTDTKTDESFIYPRGSG